MLAWQVDSGGTYYEGQGTQRHAQGTQRHAQKMSISVQTHLNYKLL